MENLQQERLNRDDRIEEAVAPFGIAGGLTRRENGLGLEVDSLFGLETLKHGGHKGHHRDCSYPLWVCRPPS